MELGAPDESGRRRPVPVSGSEHEIETDLVVFAIGTNANPIIGQTSKLRLNKRGYIETDDDLATSMAGVFAGGDIVIGAATCPLLDFAWAAQSSAAVASAVPSAAGSAAGRHRTARAHRPCDASRACGRSPDSREEHTPRRGHPGSPDNECAGSAACAAAQPARALTVEEQGRIGLAT
jgi:heterodisulfide reductase subunit A-like polyferredoxin